MIPQMEPVTDASAWTGDDLRRDRSWVFNLTSQHQADLDTALQGVKERGLQLAEIAREDFPLPSLQISLQNIFDELRDGRGFVFLRGFPIEGYGIDDVEKMYWGLITYLGTGVTQNSEAGLIHHVTDGKSRPQQGTRGVGNPGPVGLHIDLADCVALCCIRQAPDDPHSVVASAMTVYNEILRQHPQWLPRLYEGFIWTRRAEEASGETPVSNFRIPAYSAAGGKVTCRFNGSWIKAGMELAGESLTDEEKEIFDFIRQTAAAYSYAFPLHPGDIAICNNYTVFHGRAGHEPIDNETQKRLLLRIWMDLPEVRPFADEGCIRYGTIRYGKLGWTAADLLAGRHHTAHRRRADGVPEVL